MELFVETFARGVALCLFTALILRLLHRAAAAYRHLVCTLALCGLLVLPLAYSLLPPLPLLAPKPVLAPKPETSPAPMAFPQIARTSEPVTRPESVPAQEPIIAASPPASTPTSVSQEVPATAPEPIPSSDRSPLLLTLWALGAALLLTRLLVVLYRLHLLTAGSQRAILQGTDVLVSERVVTPLTWGVRSPVILLPTTLLSGDPALRESALRHEQAHIARRDWLWHLLAEVVCALSWFQPGAWWLRRRLRAESERACDDRVLLSGIAAPDYAAHLLEILRTSHTPTVAPSMASCGAMEARLRHILDTRRSRRAKTLRLGLTLILGMALLPVAMLRVSARPGTNLFPRLPEASASLSTQQPLPPRTVSGVLPTLRKAPGTTAAMPSYSTPLRVSPTPVSLATTGLPPSAPLKTAIPTEPPRNRPTPDPVVPLREIIWGKVVDGLEAGFWLTTPGFPNNQRVPFNSLVSYSVVVRNTTEQDIEFLVRLLPYEGLDAPYLIPSDHIVEALGGRDIPQKFRAKGAPHNARGLDPAYIVTLTPGETVLIPGEFGLYVGDADSGGKPRVAKIEAGMNWIVQPLTIQTLPPAERSQFNRLLGRYELTKVGRDGKARREAAVRIHAPAGGKTLYTRIQLEVGTLDAAAARNADRALWGKVDKGLQGGIRLLNAQRTFSVGDMLEAELLWRNVNNARINTPLPRRLDLYPTVQDEAGHEIRIDFGARFDIIPMWHTFEPGEVRSLGVVKVKLVPEGTPSPKSNMEPGHITLAPGTYKLSGYGGVSAPDGGKPKSGEVKFRVVAGEVDPNK